MSGVHIVCMPTSRQKKNAPFMMHRKSNAVRQKAKRREGDARKAKRKEKVQFRGKVRR